MARNIPSHIIDEIMQASRIEEVIGDFVNLKRAGSSLKGLSPFTDEKTPSFVVSPAKQIFKCFSTGKGGNVVSFLMEKEHFSYPEALTWLADRYGIQLPEERPATAEELAAISERESLHIINEFARDHFMHNLHESEEGKAIALSYFEERGFRPEIIKKFQLGYCLNTGDDFTKHSLAKGFKLNYLEKVGLVKTKDDRHFDFFRGRVIFPIHSVTGRILGFGGRTLFTDKKIAKYFNSPESIIYNKSEILYGLHFAKGDIVKYDNCFLCEGYTDVISMHQAGINHSVSSSGTSLTKDQIKLVRRYTNNITILYDGDPAGIKASFRGIDLILEEGMNVKVVLFPEGEDPDSFSKKVSSTEFEEYISSHMQDFISFKADILLKDGETDPLKRAELIKEVTHSVSLIPDQITRTVYTQQIAQVFGINEQVVNNELLKLRKNTLSKQLQEPEIRELPIELQSPIPSTELISNKPNIYSGELSLIRVMVKYGAYEVTSTRMHEGKENSLTTSAIELICNELTQDELTFSDPLFNKIHQLFLDGLEKNEIYQTSFLRRYEDQDIVRFVTDIETSEHELSEKWVSKYGITTTSEADNLESTILQVVYTFKFAKIVERIHAIREILNSDEIEYDEKMFHLNEQIRLEKVKLSVSEKLGRIILK